VSDQTISKAARELVDGIRKALPDDAVETAIAGAGYLAGAALLATTKIDLSSLEPGSIVFGPDFDESGPRLLGTLADLCRQEGAEVTFEAMGRPVPNRHEPKQGFLGLMRSLLPVFHEVIHRNHIGDDERPLVAVHAAAQLILAGRETLDPSIGAAIAANAILEGTKRVPPRD